MKRAIQLRAARWVLPVVLACLAPQARSNPGPSASVPSRSAQSSTRTYRLPFERLAGDFLEAVGREEVDPARIELQELLADAFLRIRIGVLDVRYPLEALAHEDLGKTRGKDLAQVLRGLLEMHRVWVQWIAPEEKLARDLRDAFDDVDELLEDWDGALSGEGLAAGQRDLWALLDLDEGERAALEAVQAAGRSPELDEGRDPEGTQVVLCPDRRTFLEFVGVVGASRPEMKPHIWKDDVRTWTEFWMSYPRDVQILAMEYAELRGDLFAGTGMNRREKTGLVQHVVQRAAFSLSWYCFGRGLDPVFEAGLAQNLAIAVCGENNARSGGSGRASETHAREVFVPGGLSQGGILPAWNADSRWRDERGREHFAGVLKSAQKAGYKAAGRKAGKLASFELLSDDQGRAHVVRAPFLGTPGDAQEPAPSSFVADYLEFFRAYKSAFVHWMRTEAGGRKRGESAARWSELLVSLARGPGEAADGGNADFEAVVQQVYGVPLSAPDGETESLEWRFLEWLVKQ